MVHFPWVAACDRNQCCIGIFYNALWIEIWEGPLCELVGIHDCVFFSEHPNHSATEGKMLTLCEGPCA